MGILNSCVTPQGRRLLEQWIKQPLKDLNLINERLDIVECFMKDSETRALINKDTLTRMTDLIILFKKLSGKRAKLQDCYKLNQAVDSLPALIYSLRKLNNKCVTAVFLDSLSEVYANMEKYQYTVNSKIKEVSLSFKTTQVC